jgi:hypothetical protein
MPFLLALGAVVACAAEPSECPSPYVLHADGYCWLPDEEPEPIDISGLPEAAPDAPCTDVSEQDLGAGSCAAFYEGDVYFETEAQMADFCASWHCVNGGVQVGGREGDITPGMEITSLAPLSCLRQARFLFIGQNRSLVDVELPALRRLEGGLSIVGNEGLLSVSLPELRRVGELSVQHNPDLELLDLPSLLWVTNNFIVTDNPRLSRESVWDLRNDMCYVGGATSVLWDGP